MIKKKQSRAAKMVLASLLAVSLSAPTFSTATFANTNESTPVVTANQSLKDGTYDIVPTMTKGMNSHFQEPAKLIVKDGKMSVQLVILEKSNSMVGSLQSERSGELTEMDVIKGTTDTATRTVSFPVTELGKTINAHVVVNVPPNPAMPDGAVMPHDFEITVSAPVEKPDQNEAAAKTFAVTVYKDGTNEESTMEGYIEPTVKIAKTATGHEVTMTIKKNQEQYIHGFKVAGKEATKAMKDGKATYTFDVANTTSKINAEIHVIVDAYGVKYDQNHKIQLGFESNPFSDINKDGNKDAIINLFQKDIVKGNAKFNPANKINRSQFALMIYRALDMKPAANAGFKDIANLPDKELVNAINALADAGIVKKGDKFNPTNTLTRSQGALMLYRAVNFAQDEVVDAGDASLSYYVDGNTVSDPEAKEAFGFLYNNDIMTGSPTANGKKAINAASSLSRSQMAKILNGSLNFMDEN